jgi:hypothetical protein
MPRSKQFDYFMDEIDWSYGCGYRIRIPYVDQHGQKRIYHQTFSARKLGLSMPAAKRLAQAERDRLIVVLGAAPPKKKKARRRFKPRRRVGVYKAKLLAYGKTYPYWVAYWRTNGKTERKYFSIASLGSALARQRAIETRQKAERQFPSLGKFWSGGARPQEGLYHEQQR